MLNKLKSKFKLKALLLKRTWLLVLCLMCVNSLQLLAQNTELSGTVTDSKDGDPIPGVNILVQGTSKGTVTDEHGKFKLSVPPNAVLTVSYVGYNTEQIPVNGQSEINIALIPDIKSLDDVVVIGYQKVKKRDVLGAVSSIDEKSLKDLPVSSVAEALTGKMAGVNITTTEGSPDATILIRVRGGNSITQDNTPLLIVDGFPVSSISNIAPNDIQSIDVLKDAASTAIYGSQGANGVIIVTTKSGKKGKISVNLSEFTGIKKTYNLTNVLSPYEYVYYQKELDPGTSVTGTSFYGMYGAWEDRDIYKSKPGNDWQKKLFGNTGRQQNYNLSLNGGGDFLSFLLSYTHDNEDYIGINSGFKRDNINFKINGNISPKLSVDFNVRLANSTITGPGVSAGKKMKDCIQYAPVLSLTSYSYDILESTGDYLSPEAQSALRQPYDDMENTYKKQYQFNNVYNAGVTWKILNPLTFRSALTYGFDKNRTDNVYTKGSGESSSNGGQPLADRTVWDNSNWMIQNYLTYDKTFIEKHKVSIIIGQEARTIDSKSTTISSKFYPADMTTDQILAMWNYGSSNPTNTSIAEPKRSYSYYGRLSYTLLDKYLFAFTAREDGINSFAPGHRWGFFPAGSIAWRISEEEFLKNQNIISDLKLRYTYGSVGNGRVDPYWRQDYSFETATNSLYYINESTTSALKPSTTLRNSDLTWETTAEQNLGLDFSFFKERIRGSIELYKHTTKDLIVQVPIPSYSGYTYQFQNIGQTTNKGLELTLSGDVVRSHNFRLAANFNIAYNRNNVDKFKSSKGNYATYSSGWSSTVYDFKIEEGKPLGQILGYVTDGMYTFDDFTWNDSQKKWILNQTDANGNTIPDISTLITTSGNYYGPGHLKLKDLNGDGKITLDDQQVLGNTLPIHTGGFGLNAGWKGIDLNVNFNWSYGNKVLNAGKMEYSTLQGSKKYNNLISDMKLDNRFTTIDPETGKNIYYGADANPDLLRELNQDKAMWHPILNYALLHSWAVEDGSFLRLNTLTLGYTIPAKITNKVKIRALRVFVTGYNLYCWTNYSGQDPEVSTRNGNSSASLTPGVDYSAYPKAHQYLFGVNLTF